MKLKYLLGLSCFFLAGCANTGNSYHIPQNAVQYATIRGCSDMKLTAAKHINVSQVDGRDIGLVWSENSKIKLTPGTHIINAYAEFSKGLLGGAVSDTFTLKFVAQAGQDYIVQGELRGNQIYAWITNNKGYPVTAKQSKETLPAGSSIVSVNQIKQ